MCGECFGQDLFGVLQGDTLDGRAGLAQDILPVVQHQVFLGDAVRMVFVDKQAHGRHNHLYADGCFEQEGFVADELDVRRILAETLDESLRHIVLADEDGYLAEVEATGLQQTNLFGHVSPPPDFLPVGGAFLVELYPHIAFPVVFLFLLLDVRIDLAKFYLCIGSYGIESFCSYREEGIVEIHDGLMAAVVDVERFGDDVEALKFLFVLYAVENLPVAVAPSVDALLDVAHQ